MLSQFAFIVGVFWTLICVAALRELFKNGPDVFAFSPLHTVLWALISFHLSVLDIVILLPRFRSWFRSVFNNGAVPPQDLAQDSPSSSTIFKHHPGSPTGSPFVEILHLLVFQRLLASKTVEISPTPATGVTDQVGDVAEYVDPAPGAYDTGERDNITTLRYLCLLPLLAFCVPLFIGWHSIHFVLSFARSSLKRIKDKTASDDSTEDITLVEESANEGKDSSEFSPFSPDSHSTPVICSIQEEDSELTRSASFHLRTDASSFIPSVSSRQADENAAQADAADPKPIQATLNPSALAFLPTARVAALIPTPDAGIPTTDNSSNEWQPTKPLSFPWARGGCATQIIAPPRASLNVAATAFVPKARTAQTLDAVDKDEGLPDLSANTGASSTVVVVKKQSRVFKSNPPSFWAPGGCDIRIVVPPVSSCPGA